MTERADHSRQLERRRTSPDSTALKSGMICNLSKKDVNSHTFKAASGRVARYVDRDGVIIISQMKHTLYIMGPQSYEEQNNGKHKCKCTMDTCER